MPRTRPHRVLWILEDIGKMPPASDERWLTTQPRVRQISAPKRRKSPPGLRKRSMKRRAST
jgi:hypothetical protein